ncbi:MAG: fibronectin type III domain-containing protein [Vicinamibacterales bacterium]
MLTANGRAVLPGTGGLTPVALSRDRRRLYAYRLDSVSAAPAAAVIVDAFTGQTLRDTPFPTPYASITGPTFSDDESAIWLMTRSPVGSTGAWYLRRLDGVTGAEVFSVTFDTSIDGFREFRMLAPQLDEQRQRVMVSTWLSSRSSVDIVEGPGRITTLDANTGAPIGLSDTVGPMALFVDSTSDRLLTASQSVLTEFGFPAQCSPLTVVTHDLGSLARLGIATADAGACFVTGFAAPPAAPQMPAVNIDQQTVTVQWQPPAETVTGYVVEAGTAPGLANIASFPMPGTSLVVPNVPSGRYFVRIRARNHIGWGVATDDIVVDVP